ncbi:MAG: M23 family metallopeptidase [Clostridia bacterium]|nr:M23 family metallopeptidase [Clostridia bacterium]
MNKEKAKKDNRIVTLTFCFLWFLKRAKTGTSPIAYFAINQYKNDKELWNFGKYEGIVGETTWRHLGLEIIENIGDADNYIYPLERRPDPGNDPNTGGRVFGSKRKDGRRHAGMDLVVPPGTKVIAMTDGVVDNYSPTFYEGTGALTVNNADGTVVRYGEISSTLKKGTEVKRGQVIGTVIANNSPERSSMLHIEYYTGEAAGPLTCSDNLPYMRRSDLTDPMFIQYLPIGGNK